MQINLAEMKENVHYKNASGVSVGCADCHVPRSIGPKLWAKLMAAKDVYHEIMGTIDTPEKFEARRWHMANLVWDKMKASDSRECRECHSFEKMDFEEQDKSAAKKHHKAIEAGETCIDCHKGIAHEEPEEPEDELQPAPQCFSSKCLGLLQTICHKMPYLFLPDIYKYYFFKKSYLCVSLAFAS